MEIILLFIGLYSIALSIFNFLKKINCQKPITGVFVKNHSIKSSYAPVFTYTFNNQEFTGQSFEAYMFKANKLKIGNTYTIFINEKKPKDFVLNKKIRFADIMVFIFGLLFIFAYYGVTTL